MSLRVAVAAPFKQHGAETVGESEFVVALSLDRDWFSPDQAKRVVEVAAEEGLLTRSQDDDGGGDVRAEFDYAAVDVPADFEPDESVFAKRSPFERVLSEIVAADGGTGDKQGAVAAINDLQERLGVTVDAAAVVYARSQGLAVEGPADAAMEALRERQ